jgi:hypothetical protein
MKVGLYPIITPVRARGNHRTNAQWVIGASVLFARCPLAGVTIGYYPRGRSSLPGCAERALSLRVSARLSAPFRLTGGSQSSDADRLSTRAMTLCEADRPALAPAGAGRGRPYGANPRAAGTDAPRAGASRLVEHGAEGAAPHGVGSCSRTAPCRDRAGVRRRRMICGCGCRTGFLTSAPARLPKTQPGFGGIHARLAYPSGCRTFPAATNHVAGNHAGRSFKLAAAGIMRTWSRPSTAPATTTRTG